MPRLDLHPRPSGVIVAVPILAEASSEIERLELQQQMLDDLLSAHETEDLVFWYYTPLAIEFSDHVRPDLCVYDCMDELSGFRGASPRLGALERRLFGRCDIVFAGGQSLYEAKRDKHPNVHAFPSSIDKGHFAKARREGVIDPPDQAPLRRPRIGFFGVIDERMDLELVGKAANLRPGWEFVMLGPVVKIDAATLPKTPNVHWLGSKQYSELPSYLAGWDAGFMPFALNEATRFISPTKTPEFLAAGIPVVSTEIVDVVRPYGRAGLVEIASCPEEMVLKLDLLLARTSSAWLQKVDRYLADLSWDHTWEGMGAIMRSNMRRNSLPAATVSASSRG